MTHATYAFLLKIDAEDEAGLRNEAMAEFESYADQYCDENNWSQELIAVRRDGLLADLCPSPDWRGRDATYAEFAALPADKRWDHALGLAWRVVAIDMNVRAVPQYDFGLTRPEEQAGRDWLDAASPEAIREAICTEVPRRLAEMFRAYRTDEEFMVWYRRKTLAASFGQFTEALSRHCAPFAAPATPYDHYRAFDLTHGDQDADAIMLVDIHT